MISPIPLGLDGAAVHPASPCDSDESSSPSTSLSDKSRPSQSRISHISDACSLAVLAIVILDLYGSADIPDSLHRKPAGAGRAAVGPGSTSTSCLSTEIASTSWSSSWPSTVIGSRGGAVAVRKRRRAPIAVATSGGSRPPSGGLTRPAKPHPEGTATSSCGGGCGGRLRYRTLHYANARVRTPTDHGLSVSIPISGVSA